MIRRYVRSPNRGNDGALATGRGARPPQELVIDDGRVSPLGAWLFAGAAAVALTFAVIVSLWKT